MADGATANPGSGGLKWATDEDTSQSPAWHWPWFKQAWGPNDVFNKVDDVAGKRLPVKTDHEKTCKTAPISVAANGDNAIVALVAGKRIKVYSIVLFVQGTVSVKWRSNTTDLTGAMDFQVREGHNLALPPPSFILATAAGQALNLNLSAAVGVRGWVSYFDDDAA